MISKKQILTKAFLKDGEKVVAFFIFCRLVMVIQLESEGVLRPYRVNVRITHSKGPDFL